MKNLNTDCSYCGADLRTPENELRFKLYLIEHTKYHRPERPTDAIDHPNHHHYFCGYECLGDWMVEKRLGIGNEG